MPCEISTVSLIQSEQSAPAEDVPSMGAPQLQHRMLHHVSASSPFVDRGASTNVADCCGTKGLCGNATGASRSMDMGFIYHSRFAITGTTNNLLRRMRMKRSKMYYRGTSKVRHLLASSAAVGMQQHFAIYARLSSTPFTRVSHPLRTKFIPLLSIMSSIFW